MPDSTDALSVVFRAVSFVLLLNAAGIAIFIAVLGRWLADSRMAIHRLGWQLAVAALAFVTGHQLLEAARMAGEMGGMVDPAMQETAMRSPQGAAFGLRVLGLTLVAVGLWRGAVAVSLLGAVAVPLMGVVLCVVSFALTGHTSVAPHRAALAVLLIFHLLVVAFWLGALWPLCISTSKETPSVAARLIDAFSKLAVWLVPGIAVAGVALTALLVPNLAVFKQPYGQLVLAKVALFAVLMGLAAFNKWTFGPAIGTGDARVAGAFRRTVICEYVLICAVLTITAILTTFYSPEAP